MVRGGWALVGALALAVILAVAAAGSPVSRAGAAEREFEAAFDVELRDVNPRSKTYGEQVRLSRLWRDGGLVVNFLASWCPPCRAELPMLEELHREGRANVVCLAADEYGGAEGLLPMLDQAKTTIPVLYAPDETAKRIAEHYTYEILPATYLIDGEGRVRSWHQGLMKRKTLVGLISSELGRERAARNAAGR